MNDDNSLTPERPTFSELRLVMTTEEVAPQALTPFATLGPSERWLHDILTWAYSQPDLHAARYCYELGRCLRQGSRHRAAWPALEVALAICCRQKGQKPLASSLSEMVLAALGELLDDIVEKPEAVAYLRRALVVWRALYGPTHPEIGEILNNLGKAHRFLKRSLLLYESKDVKSPLEVASVLHNLGTLYCATGSLNAATNALGRAYELRCHRLGPHHPDAVATSRILHEALITSRHRKRHFPSPSDLIEARLN